MPEPTEGKYAPLGRYLGAAVTDTVTLTFAEIEVLLGAPLPAGARRSVSWWANTQTALHARTWLAAGWRSWQPNLYYQRVTFVRVVPDSPA